jgi:hypothetical protein
MFYNAERGSDTSYEESFFFFFYHTYYHLIRNIKGTLVIDLLISYLNRN